MADSPEPASPESLLPESLLPDSAYRVLARKYRPQSFADLIGQEAMVRTLSNAFTTKRIHQAYIFTGVRGVGKTTTARILARALNYETDTIKAPTIDMPEPGIHCQAIIESRHVDVIEMDAASNTSIDDIREIIEAARYKPVSARTKVYIIDEVHMLSKAAFNGLLKTLEEPPPHVKFLFATTEIRKVPVTVLSRCQRFDLRRIEIPAMMDYLETIIAKEGVTVEEEALMLLARASEGSMRDALSLLDQAIAHGSGTVRAEEVRASLGLADRTRVIDLFEAVMSGDISRALVEFESQFNEGAEPLAILTDLGEFVHVVTRLKLVPEAARDPALSETERQRGLAFSKQVPIRALTMAWQIILKGLGEVQAASRPRMAAEMVLVRLAYAADLPSPGDMIRDLRNGTIAAGTAPAAPPAPPSGGPVASLPRLVADNAAPALPVEAVAAPLADGRPQPASLTDLVALARQNRDIRMMTALERHVRVTHFEPGKIDLVLLPLAEPDLPNRLHKVLLDWTGRRWMVSVVSDMPAGTLPKTLHEEAEAAEAETRQGVMALPTIQAILNRFPGTEIVGIREPAEESLPPAEPDALDREAEITDDDL
ncbi:MAG: DNA polymerase III subunit gamma/tau [Beijerinckiaceae bacterium]|nr:DNA polymerase III subunit gamma/tau [Beijerinckiaceae bacterium]MCZ8300976.1 DNA polymerase III subunit gamma/tau [Beijerinckiaceae bacterium]